MKFDGFEKDWREYFRKITEFPEKFTGYQKIWRIWVLKQKIEQFPFKDNDFFVREEVEK